MARPRTLTDEQRKQNEKERVRRWRADQKEKSGAPSRPRYLPNDKYAALVTAFFDGRFDPLDQVNNAKIALGEIGDIWPVSIKPGTRRPIESSPPKRRKKND